MSIIKRALRRVMALVLCGGIICGAAAAGYTWPTNPTIYKLSRGYIYGSHYGMDIVGEKGDDIVAAAAGTVAYVWTGCNNFSGYATGATCSRRGICTSTEAKYAGYCNHGFGNSVVIYHGDNTWTVYAHLTTIASGITAGMTVKQGQAIGTMGSTGRSTGVHLHFGVKRGGGGDFWKASYVNPAYYVSTSVTAACLAPSSVKLSSDKHYINEGDSAEFTFSSVSATSCTLKIESGGKTVYSQSVTGSKKLTYKFTDSGEYTVTYAAANAAGTVKAQETVTVFSSSVDIDDGNTAPSENYCDISGHWAEDDILSAYENGIFDGGLMFYPESTVSRATFVTVLGKLYEHMGGVIPDMTETDFSDVTASQWYARYVAWAAENGIATGSDGVFDPDGSIQRQQIAAMICRFEDAFGITVKAVNESVDFADADEISDYAREYVARMYVSGIMTGRSGNTFSPESSVTKAEIAVIITRLMEAE